MASPTLSWIKKLPLKKLMLVSVAAVSLSGCSMYSLEELRQTNPSGTPFQNQLSRFYMDYASKAEHDYDWFNSWHFADKGLALAYGRDVGPEDLNEWDLPKEALPALEKARASLLSVLTPDLERVMPARTAEAQFYFDCWVKEQSQNWREDEITNCHDNLIRALADLHATGVSKIPSPAHAHKKMVVTHKKAAVIEPSDELPAEPVVVKKAKSDKPVKAVVEKLVAKKAEIAKAKPAPVPEPIEIHEAVPESTSYAVFFEPDKAEVSEPGMNVITEVIKSLRDAPDYVVILHSSKDHPGKAAERIQVVKKLLSAGGVKDSAIHVASGKTEVEGGSAAARRVEIFLNE